MPWPWETLAKAIKDLPNPIRVIKDAVSGVHPVEAITGHDAPPAPPPPPPPPPPQATPAAPPAAPAPKGPAPGGIVEEMMKHPPPGPRPKDELILPRPPEKEPRFPGDHR